MKKPVIGVIPLFDREKDSLWMLPGYFIGIETAGGLPVMLSLNCGEDSERILDFCDGLVFTGGQDVDPSLYGEAVDPVCGELCPARDRLEPVLLQKAMERGVPALGICRGLQLINACLGGTIWQDMAAQRPNTRNHRMDRPYDRAEHSVSVSGPLAALYGTDKIGVNSCHHQGIKILAPCLREMAVAEDGLVEAFYHPEQPFLWAVQWHPEFFNPVTGPGVPIFRALVEQAKKHAENK